MIAGMSAVPNAVITIQVQSLRYSPHWVLHMNSTNKFSQAQMALVLLFVKTHSYMSGYFQTITSCTENLG
jgi:hypothetical protein